LDTFVLNSIAANLESASYNQAQAFISGYLRQSCRALAFGDNERAFGMEKMAQLIWQRFMEWVSRGVGKNRRRLPPYDQMKRNAVEDALKSLPPALRESLRQQLPPSLLERIMAPDDELGEPSGAAGPMLEGAPGLEALPGLQMDQY
jgi:hypothetical protein